MIQYDKCTGNLEIVVSEEFSGRMIKDLIKAYTNMTRPVLREILMQGGVKRNHEACFLTNRVQTGDRIQIQFPQDEIRKVQPEPIPLCILYEDPYIIVLDKQAGVVVHPTKGYPTGTLANGLAYHYQIQELYLKIRPVPRVD